MKSKRFVVLPDFRLVPMLGSSVAPIYGPFSVYGTPHPRAGVGGVSVYTGRMAMRIECVGGPWDGEAIPLQGQVVTVSAVPSGATQNDERFGCYVLTAKGYAWEADE